ncbi:MAG: nuclear transport factor 2 family protein [Terracidiphilus sp.]|jgi:hypothetical protein
MKALALMAVCVSLAPTLALAKQPVSASKLENRFWQALQQKDLATLKAMMTPDYLSVEDGISTREQVISNLAHCELIRFTLSDQREEAISAKVFATIYRIREEATCGEMQYDGTYIATTVWVSRDGRWLAQLHTEHPLEDKSNSGTATEKK